MSGNGDKTENTELEESRLACKQFARLFFHFCKTLATEFDEKTALALVQKTVFGLSLDRSGRAKEKAKALGLDTTLENFPLVNDLPQTAWSRWKPEMGGVRCPYAEVWLEYFRENPWFKPFASLYCDVIDTTNIENFTGTLSHKITKNLLWGDAFCDREYFESDAVKEGRLSYAPK